MWLTLTVIFLTAPYVPIRTISQPTSWDYSGLTVKQITAVSAFHISCIGVGWWKQNPKFLKTVLACCLCERDCFSEVQHISLIQNLNISVIMISITFRTHEYEICRLIIMVLKFLYIFMCLLVTSIAFIVLWTFIVRIY